MVLNLTVWMMLSLNKWQTKKQEPLEYQQSALQIMQASPKNISGYIEL